MTELEKVLKELWEYKSKEAPTMQECLSALSKSEEEATITKWKELLNTFKEGKCDQWDLLIPPSNLNMKPTFVFRVKEKSKMTEEKLYRFSGTVEDSYFQINTITFPILEVTAEEIMYKEKYVINQEEKETHTSINKDKLLKIRTLTAIDHDDLSNYFVYCESPDVEEAIEKLVSTFKEIILKRRLHIDRQLFYLEDYINDYII